MGAHWLSFFGAQHLVSATYNYWGTVLREVLSSFFNTLNLALCSMSGVTKQALPKCGWEHTLLWSVHCMNIILSRKHLSHQTLHQVTKASCTLPCWLPKIAQKPTHQHSFKRTWLHVSRGLIFQGLVMTDKRTNVVEILFDGQSLTCSTFWKLFE